MGERNEVATQLAEALGKKAAPYKTLRDEFAMTAFPEVLAAAMKMFEAGGALAPGVTAEDFKMTIARDCYAWADRLLAAREEGAKKAGD